jgi:hypothetical protein
MFVHMPRRFATPPPRKSSVSTWQIREDESLLWFIVEANFIDSFANRILVRRMHNPRVPPMPSKMAV